MYIPSHFQEDRIDVLHDLLRTHSLATVVSYGSSGLIASHVPLVLDPNPAPLGSCRTRRGDGFRSMSNRPSRRTRCTRSADAWSSTTKSTQSRPRQGDECIDQLDRVRLERPRRRDIEQHAEVDVAHRPGRASCGRDVVTGPYVETADLRAAVACRGDHHVRSGLLCALNGPNQRLAEPAVNAVHAT